MLSTDHDTSLEVQLRLQEMVQCIRIIASLRLVDLVVRAPV